jgi:ribonuclease HII
MRYTCGIDEAGRGPLAGPVTAAAVVLGPRCGIDGLADSKGLTHSRREALRALITDGAVAWAIGWASHREIDRLNIHRATLLAMKRAFFGLSVVPRETLVDGRFCPDLGVPCTAVVGGDNFVPEIQAASILAKTLRDAWMANYARTEPQYLFERHKGYPTPDHRSRIARYGPSRIQRLSFTVSTPASTDRGVGRVGGG